MADAALSLAPPTACDAPRGLSVGTDRLCALCGLVALAWVPASLWPGLALPAWPAASAGLLALALSLWPGRVVPKALGTIAGFLGFIAGVAEIGALWSVAWVMP